MKKLLLLLLFLASPLFADGVKYSYEDPRLNAEFDAVYKDLLYLKAVNVTASTATFTQLNVSTLTATGRATFVQINATTGTINSFMVVGTATNDSAPTGRIGEVISASVPKSSPVGLVTNTAKTITSIPLTAGDWDVRIMAGFIESAGTTTTELWASVSLTTNQLLTADTVDVPTSNEVSFLTSGAASLLENGGVSSISIPDTRVLLSGPATVYFVAEGQFAGGTLSGFGSIVARRMR